MSKEKTSYSVLRSEEFVVKDFSLFTRYDGLIRINLIADRDITLVGNSDVSLGRQLSIERLANNWDVKYLRVGDVVSASFVYKNKLVASTEAVPMKLAIQVIERTDNPTAKQIMLNDTCPICGSNLVFKKNTGKHYCNNHCCALTINHHTRHLLGALGVSLTPRTNNLLEEILSRRVIVSPDEIFDLNDKDAFDADDSEQETFQLLQVALHSRRGHVNFGDVLYGLCLPGWDKTVVNEFLGALAPHLGIQWGDILIGHILYRCHAPRDLYILFANIFNSAESDDPILSNEKFNHFLQFLGNENNYCYLFRLLRILFK